MDKADQDVCGPAIAHLLQRAYQDYGDARYRSDWPVCPSRTCTTYAKAPTAKPGA